METDPVKVLLEAAASIDPNYGSFSRVARALRILVEAMAKLQAHHDAMCSGSGMDCADADATVQALAAAAEEVRRG